MSGALLARQVKEGGLRDAIEFFEMVYDNKRPATLVSFIKASVRAGLVSAS